MNSWKLLGGDCLETLTELEGNSIDAVVTDPPYGLSVEPDPAEVLRHWLDGDDYQHRGGGFMGNSWDSFVPGPKVWAECHRVLKPGGHLVAFFGTRTYDLGAMAIRLAGFEIRDCISWHYGSGFPKSLNVSKQLDKASGIERETESPVDEKPVSELARQWNGWGTALKPATEPVVLARKALKGTVAENVTQHGTGALNIDGCRIEVDPDDPVNTAVWTSRPSAFMEGQGFLGGSNEDGEQRHAKPDGGRWPANLILDEAAGEILDEQSGESSSSAASLPLPKGHAFAGELYGELKGNGATTVRGHNDIGGASRFFYCPKANSAERNAGLDDFEKKPKAQLAGAAAGSDDPVSQRYISEPMANQHPTVKPIDLMRYLCRLITPPGGTVLDPFSGSGTTGIAAGLEGFDFVGIEREDSYRAIAEARLEWWADKSGDTLEILQRERLVEKEREQKAAMGQVSLFEGIDG